MILDPSLHGFGWLTLWLGALLLVLGYFLPVIGLSEPLHLHLKVRSRSEVCKYGGSLLVFLVSIIVYLITIEPTASLWDCSEFIASAYKLEVPHTPGTPLTLLLGRVFSMFAFGDQQLVAVCINSLSACCAALSISIIYLVIWQFAGKWVNDIYLLMLGSIVGSLSLAFSDTFWFSAVEAETYGPSIFFMVLMIWLALKPRKKSIKKRILLLSYLAGLSYCIHPMCILILPVVILALNVEGQKFSVKKAIMRLFVGVGIVLFISKVIAVDLFEWAFKLDLWLVNALNMPFYSGVLLLGFLLTIPLVILWNKYKKARTYLLSLIFVLAGFSPYLMLFVRSAQFPPINEFSPNNLAMIKPYMNRESYPGRPLLHGPYFDAQMTHTSRKASAYIKASNEYLKLGDIYEYHYDEKRSTILPRIYSNKENHIEVYKRWCGLSEGEEPGFVHNLKFLLKYQLGHMYGRYFLWNFAGRNGDQQHSDWLTPWERTSNRGELIYNRAQNQLYFLPLLLGVIGFFIHLKKNRKDFLVNLSFFLITGILLAIYLNATPNEPRERDYIYVGSYAAFSIWIGLGWISLSQLLNPGFARMYLMPVFGLTFLGWIYYQNLDDHDRSGRTFQIDNARNTLGSCEEKSILFTGGDNDTFPLWYLQEVEGFRTCKSEGIKLF